MDPTNPGLTHDLYPGVGPEQRAYLKLERRPTRRDAVSLGPYPVAPETAAAVEAMQSNYVLSFELFRQRHLALWLHDTLTARGAPGIPIVTPVLMRDKLEVFQRVAEARLHWEGTDYRHGLAGVTDAVYEMVFSHLEGAVAALALEEPLSAGVAAFMPELPFGPAPLRHVPLIDRRWIDLDVLVLCEAGALLDEEGMVRLPPADPHPLAWDRFFAPDTDWSDPRPARPEVLSVAVTQVRASLSRCPCKLRVIDGRPHMRVDQYFGWPGRYVTGPLKARRVEGLIVKTWNGWIDQESETGWLEVCGHHIGKVDHPCPLTPGKDYRAVAGAQELREALAVRAAALVHLRNDVGRR